VGLLGLLAERRGGSGEALPHPREEDTRLQHGAKPNAITDKEMERSVLRMDGDMRLCAQTWCGCVRAEAKSSGSKLWCVVSGWQHACHRSVVFGKSNTASDTRKLQQLLGQ
jgi:hypothetical protein